MKKRTLRPWTKVWARHFLGPLRKLEKMYQEGRESKSVGGCPLCVATYCEEGYLKNCAICPWMVFKERTCQTGGSHFRNTPIPKRLPRVRGFIRRCENIINKPVKRRAV